MRRNLRWLILGLLLCGSALGYFLYDPRENVEMPEDVRNQIVEALEAKYVIEVKHLEQDVASLQNLADHWGQRYTDQVRLTQRWKSTAQRAPAILRVKGDTVHAPVEFLEIEGDCTISEPRIGGTCTGEMYTVGGKQAAKVYWSALASFHVGDREMEIDSGEPRLTTELEWEAEVPVRLRRSLVTLRAGLTTAPGVSVGGSLWRGTRRLGYWGQVDYMVDANTYSVQDNYSYRLSGDEWQVSGGVAWRFGG